MPWIISKNLLAILAGNGPLQFADFFSSFIAVLLVCLYLTRVPPTIKLPFYVTTSLVAAVIAADHATR